MTYNSLLEDLSSYLERGDNSADDAAWITQRPRLVTLAEKQIIQDLKIQGFREVVTGVLVASQAVYTKPDRWRETISLTFTNGSAGSFTDRTPLYQRDYTYLQLLAPDRAVTGTPKYYADYDYGNIIVSPTPGEAYPFEWAFMAIPPLLSAENQTNWATQYVPNLLLYQCLVQAETWLKNDERVMTWAKLYEGAKQALTVEEVTKIGDGSNLRRNA